MTGTPSYKGPDEPTKSEPAKGRAGTAAASQTPSQQTPLTGINPQTADHDAPTTPGSPTGPSGKSQGTQGALSGTSAGLGTQVRQRYEIKKMLGKGGFGTVYLAYDRVLEQDVAIKIQPLGMASDRELKRFIFEARTSAKLRHPNIVNVFDIVQQEDKLLLIMENYPGGSISQQIKMNGAIDPKTALGYVRQVAQGLAYAHSRSIIHRDIKPANMFLTEDGEVKLGDFGIAANAERHENTKTGEVMGSPIYMSPEQTEDSKNVDGRSDLYSLGLSLYHMVTGAVPRVLDLDQTDPYIRTFLKRATALEVEDRPQTAEEFIAMIDEIMPLYEGEQAPGGGPPLAPVQGAVAANSFSATSTDPNSFNTQTNMTGMTGVMTQTEASGALKLLSVAIILISLLIVGGFGAVLLMLKNERKPGIEIVDDRRPPGRRPGAGAGVPPVAVTPEESPANTPEPAITDARPVTPEATPETTPELTPEPTPDMEEGQRRPAQRPVRRPPVRETIGPLTNLDSLLADMESENETAEKYAEDAFEIYKRWQENPSAVLGLRGLKDAAQNAELAVREAPESHEYLMLLARIEQDLGQEYVKLQQGEEAREMFRRAMAHNEKAAEINPDLDADQLQQLRARMDQLRARLRGQPRRPQ